MPTVIYADGTKVNMSEKELCAAKRESELLIIAAKKDGYTENEAKEAYGLRVLD